MGVKGFCFCRKAAGCSPLPAAGVTLCSVAAGLSVPTCSTVRAGTEHVAPAVAPLLSLCTAQSKTSTLLPGSGSTNSAAVVAGQQPRLLQHPSVTGVQKALRPL